MSHTFGKFWVVDDSDEGEADQTLWVMSGDPDEPVIVAEVYEFGLDKAKLRRHADLLASAPDLLAENERLQDLYRRTLSALKDIAVSGDDGTQEQHAPEMWAYCRERARTTVAFAHQDAADKAARAEGVMEPEDEA